MRKFWLLFAQATTIGLAVLFIIMTVLLDYWVYRAVDRLFRRLQARNRQSGQAAGGTGLHAGLENLMTGVLDRRTPMPQTEEDYAARGGDARVFPWGDDWPPPKEAA